jgi:hypothetical protein
MSNGEHKDGTLKQMGGYAVEGAFLMTKGAGLLLIITNICAGTNMAFGRNAGPRFFAAEGNVARVAGKAVEASYNGVKNSAVKVIEDTGNFTGVGGVIRAIGDEYNQGRELDRLKHQKEAAEAQGDLDIANYTANLTKPTDPKLSKADIRLELQKLDILESHFKHKLEHLATNPNSLSAVSRLNLNLKFLGSRRSELNSRLGDSRPTGEERNVGNK